MARSVKTLVGGRYKLSGKPARGAWGQRAWDRWLHRPVFIRVFADDTIDGPAAKRRFIESAQALVRVDQANVAGLLDYGATEEGAPYHVLRDDGAERASLAEVGALAWVRVRAILLDVIAGVGALHNQRIVHGDISLHSVALIGDTARLVDFAAASVSEHELSPEQEADDVRGIAALGVGLLTAGPASGHGEASLIDALARTDAPSSVQATLIGILTRSRLVDLATLRRELGGDPPRASSWGRSQMISAAATLAAAAMLMIGLWSSWASFEASSIEHSPTLYASTSDLVCEAGLGPLDGASTVAVETSAVGAPRPATQIERSAPEPSFEAARASVEVGSEIVRERPVVQTRRFNLHRDLSPAVMVERGIDLTHGRPAPQDDPRLPVVDGPARARALFETACERDYGKGCHMLGVQIAEGMIPDDGAGPAHYYKRGCALDYHRSCAALADLARAGEIVADVRLLDAKACLLAGPTSSYCLPK